MLMFNSVRVTHQQNVCLFCHFCHQLYESQIAAISMNVWLATVFPVAIF